MTDGLDVGTWPMLIETVQEMPCQWLDKLDNQGQLGSTHSAARTEQEVACLPTSTYT